MIDTQVVAGRSLPLLFLTLVLSIQALAAQQSSEVPVPIPSGFGAGAYPLGIAHPTIRRMVEVEYPRQAVRERMAGEVVLNAVVGPEGNVDKVQVQSSVHPILDAQATATVSKWTFHPARLDGKLVSVVVPISVRFYFVLAGEKLINSLTESRILAVSDSRWPTNAYSISTPGLILPTVTREIKPKYTSGAMERKLQGSVELEVVVAIDGTISHARVAKSLDRGGLDSQALLAVREWTFAPCRLNGKAVPCEVGVVLEFRLK